MDIKRLAEDHFAAELNPKEAVVVHNAAAFLIGRTIYLEGKVEGTAVPSAIDALSIMCRTMRSIFALLPDEQRAEARQVSPVRSTEQSISLTLTDYELAAAYAGLAVYKWHIVRPRSESPELLPAESDLAERNREASIADTLVEQILSKTEFNGSVYYFIDSLTSSVELRDPPPA